MSSSPSKPNAPVRVSPAGDWPHAKLHGRVREALLALPLHFRTQTNIEGISATDIFTLNSALGATIENQVMATLNLMRPLWDPEGAYRQYAFVRQAQTFPDVLLKKTGVEATDARDVIMGIELKGWYLLAKEAEPSFRFQETPAACAAADLIVVVPWALNNVISGSPMVFTPYVESSRYAAEYRNYHWQHLRDAKGKKSIVSPRHVAPYPRKSDPIADKPEADQGGNFGRFARTGIMDEYLGTARDELLAGIRAEHWLGFFKIFQDQRDPAEIRAEIEKLRSRVGADSRRSSAAVDALESILRAAEQLLSAI
jgi:hypothetical protein